MNTIDSINNYKPLMVFKPIGLTPLQCLTELRLKYKEYRNSTLTYAGRLDPMAEGLMLVLVDDQIKLKEYYQALDKEYQFSMVIGIKSDSYDILGIPVCGTYMPFYDIGQNLDLIIDKIKQQTDQVYPPFSSKTVKGRPMWWWALNNQLDKFEPPKRQVKIKKLVILNKRTFKSDTFIKHVVNKIRKVDGDFRQQQIINEWLKLEASLPSRLMEVDLMTRCSSGTYVRAIVNQIGTVLGCGAITSRITRLRVGTFFINDKDVIRIVNSKPINFNIG